MSKVSTHTEETQAATKNNATTENMPETAASVDKIRDIIFGSQIKNYDARFVRLEENLSRESAELKDAMRKRFESLEAFFKTESEALAARLRAEKEERTSLLSDLDGTVKALQAALSKRLNDIDAAMRDGDSTLRKELMTESRKLVEEVGQRHDSIRSLLEARVSELRAQKTDRALMSDLFREMAAQLSNEDFAKSE